MSFITGIYIRSDATKKHITINRKFSFVLSIIMKEIISQIISFEILSDKNFIAAFALPYIYFLNNVNTKIFNKRISNMTIRQSIKFIWQK